MDSSGKKDYTGVIFPQKKLSLIAHKKMKTISHSAYKENLKNAANQTQPTLPTVNNTAPFLIRTSFQKNNCASNNHDEPYADQLAKILIGNTQNNPNGHNKTQMINLNQSCETAPTVTQSRVSGQLRQDSIISISPKTVIPRENSSTIVSGALFSDKSMQLLGNTLDKNTNPVGKEIKTNQTLQVPNTYPLLTSKNLQFTTTGQVLSDQINDNGSFVPIHQFLNINSNAFTGEVCNLAQLQPIIPIIESPYANHDAKEINNDPAFNISGIHEPETVSEENNQDPTYELSDHESTSTDDELGSVGDSTVAASDNEELERNDNNQNPEEYPANGQNDHNIFNNDIDNRNNNGDENPNLNEERVIHITGNHNRNLNLNLENNRINNNNNTAQLLEIERTIHNNNCCEGCRNILLSSVRLINQNGLMLKSLLNNNDRNINRVHRENNFNRLEFLPINDTNLLKDFDRNLVKEDPENVELRTQFN